MLSAKFKSSIGLVGVDLDVDHVRLLQLKEHAGQLSIVGAAMEALPRLMTGEVDTAQLTERVRSTLATGGFTGRRCVVGVPRHALRVQAVRLPHMPTNELRQAIVWEASQRFELDRGVMEVDYIATGATLGPSAPASIGGGVGGGASGKAGVAAGNADHRDELLLVAAEHARYVSLLHALIHAGLRPVAAEPAFCGLARIFSRRTRRESDRDTVRAIVELGRSGSTVLVLRGDQIAFCKPLEVSGQMLDKASAEHLGIDLNDAFNIRMSRLCRPDRPAPAPNSNGAHAQVDAHLASNPTMKNQRAGDDAPDITQDAAADRAVFEAVRPLLRELAREVTLCLRYYGVVFRGKPPECIMLTGTDGREPHFAEVLRQNCKLPVHFDDPAGTLTRLAPLLQTTMNRNPGPIEAWSAAAGLALRSAAAKPTRDRRLAALSTGGTRSNNTGRQTPSSGRAGAPA